ncbi:MAG: MgtC/SapB family protein [Desulfobulbaceae bacterium]|nr:MgtC/SapB family protein [Desulfobulbaceae bacterium]
MNSYFLDPLSLDFWSRIGATLLCGGIIGLERQLRGKPAGIRTSILICLGTQVFISLGLSLNNGNGDSSRVLGQVVTGIGFIGAGVIMGKENIVRGVTSAAIIWILAGIGAAIGLGYITTAVALTMVTVLVLLGVEFLESSFRKLRRGVHAGSSHTN